jgi:hypothetical protein
MCSVQGTGAVAAPDEQQNKRHFYHCAWDLGVSVNETRSLRILPILNQSQSILKKSELPEISVVRVRDQRIGTKRAGRNSGKNGATMPPAALARAEPPGASVGNLYIGRESGGFP